MLYLSILSSIQEVFSRDLDEHQGIILLGQKVEENGNQSSEQQNLSLIILIHKVIIQAYRLLQEYLPISKVIFSVYYQMPVCMIASFQIHLFHHKVSGPDGESTKKEFL